MDYSKIFVHGIVHINGLESFWRYDKKYLAKTYWNEIRQISSLHQRDGMETQH